MPAVPYTKDRVCCIGGAQYLLMKKKKQLNFEDYLLAL